MGEFVKLSVFARWKWNQVDDLPEIEKKSRLDFT